MTVGKDRRLVAGGRPATGNMTSLLAATLGRSGGVVAGLVDSGGLGVALPCACAKRSRLLPEVFDDCSHVGCKLSPLDRAIISKVNETVFAVSFLETGGIGCSGSCEKKWSTSSCPQTWHHLHFVVSTL